MAVKKVDYLNVRLPRYLTRAIERERKRVSRELGTDIKTSDVVRGALERQFGGRRTQKARAA